MIQSFGKRHACAHIASIMLVILTTSLVVAGATAKAVVAPASSPAPGMPALPVMPAATVMPAANEAGTIRVESYAKPPAWRAEIEQKLAKRLDVKLGV